MDINQVACMIIANAGDSKSYSMAAIEAARNGAFKEAEDLLVKSNEALLKSHEAHTQILISEANEVDFKMTFILVHASNHFSIAETSREFAETIVNIYKEVKKNV